jgi:DNA-binding LytR/AlgR family response regulator
MRKLKVAVLDDNQFLLNQLLVDLEKIEEVEIAFSSTNGQDFLTQISDAGQQVDLLLSDIELEQENLSGLDIATILKKPVLFISGKSREYLERIENINLDYDFPVEFISKPITETRLKKAILKISDEIQWWLAKSEKRWIKLKINSELRDVNPDEIVYIESITDGSNNKKIYFIDGTIENLFNFSFKEMIYKGLDESDFLKINQSCRVNRKHILNIEKGTMNLLVSCPNKGASFTSLKISETNFPNIKKLVKVVGK